MVEVGGFGFVVVAKVLEKAECLQLMWKYFQVLAVMVVPRCSGAVSELEAKYSLVSLEQTLQKTVASLAEGLAGVELVGPKMAVAGDDFALVPRNS